MSDSGPAYKVDTLSRCADDLHFGGILQVVRAGDYPITWSASIYNIISTSHVYGSFLEEFPTSRGDDAIDDEQTFHP